MFGGCYNFFKTSCALVGGVCVVFIIMFLGSCWDSHWNKTWGKGREIIKNDGVKEQRNERRAEAAGRGAGGKERQRQLEDRGA